MDDRTLREYYTTPFREIVQAAQPGSIMSSYNAINGVPRPPNALPDRHAAARRRSASQGYFTSDCDAVYEIVARPPLAAAGLRPRAASNTSSATRSRMSAGEDSNCNAGYHDSCNYAQPASRARDRASRSRR